MSALVLFHVKVGIRLALRTFIPLFSALIAVIMFDMYPAAVVTSLALGLFAKDPSLTVMLPIAGLAFALPAWAAPRVTHGLNGWIRHLPLSSSEHRRGMALALLVVQMPLMVSLILLALVAHCHERPAQEDRWLWFSFWRD